MIAQNKLILITTILLAIFSLSSMERHTYKSTEPEQISNVRPKQNTVLEPMIGQGSGVICITFPTYAICLDTIKDSMHYVTEINQEEPIYALANEQQIKEFITYIRSSKIKLNKRAKQLIKKYESR